MKLGSILKITPVFILLLLAPLSAMGNMEGLEPLDPAEASALETLFNSFYGADENIDFNGMGFLKGLRDAHFQDSVSYYFAVYAGNSDDPDLLRAGSATFSNFVDNEDNPDAYVESVNLVTGAGFPSAVATDKILMIHEDHMQDIMDNGGDGLSSFVSWDHLTPSDVRIFQMTGSEFPGAEGELSEGEYFWVDLEPIYLDGDDPENNGAACLGVGEWDGTLRCCGDDGFDHGSFGPASYAGLIGEQTDGHLAAGNIPNSEPQICSLKDGLDWLIAEEQAGNIISMMGHELAAVSSGIDEVVWMTESAGSCTPEYYIDDFSTSAYLYIDHTDETSPAADRGKWFECNDNAHFNSPDTGGVNKNLGDIMVCGGSTFICTKEEGEEAYDWKPSGSFADSEEDAAACNAFGSMEGFASFTWTGSRCCMGGYMENGQVHSPLTYNDDYAPGDLPLDDMWSDAGACIVGKHFASDTTVPRKVRDWLVNFGTVQGCGPESHIVGQNAVTQNAGPGNGQDLVTPNDYCTVKTDSVPDVNEIDLSNSFVCSPDGRWLEYDKQQFEEEDLSIRHGPPMGNLAPNPTLSS